MVLQTKEVIRYQPNPLENACIGAFSGMLETSIQMPLLTWKFCLQEGRPMPWGKAMYRGLVVQAGSLAPITGLQVCINGILENFVTGGTRNLTANETMLNAMVAGACSSVIYGPADLMMIQQQRLEQSISGTFRTCSAKYGNMFIFKGLLATACREALYVGGALGGTPVICNYLRKNMDFDEQPAALTAAFISGPTCSLLSHPIDTAKTVTQADIGNEIYTGARGAGLAYYKEKGARSLFLGGFPRCMRACGAFFVLYNVRTPYIEYYTESN